MQKGKRINFFDNKENFDFECSEDITLNYTPKSQLKKKRTLKHLFEQAPKTPTELVSPVEVISSKRAKFADITNSPQKISSPKVHLSFNASNSCYRLCLIQVLPFLKTQNYLITLPLLFLSHPAYLEVLHTKAQDYLLHHCSTLPTLLY